MRAFFTIFVKNRVYANIMMLFFVICGAYALRSLPKETFPDIRMDTVRVTVLWPGADPAEVEEGISCKIEEAIEGVEGVKNYHTLSNEHMCTADVEVLEGYDIDKVKDDIRTAVDAITTMPPDAERPVVEEFLIRVQVMLLALTGPDLSDAELQDYAQKIKDEIIALPGISQVKLAERDREIIIEVSEEKLREYGITLEQVALAIKANSLNAPGGTIRTEGEHIRLRTLGRNYTAEDFANIVILARPEGYHITLDRIATVTDGFADTDIVTRFNGKNAVILHILKTDEEDTIGIDRTLREYVERKNRELPEGMNLEPWARFAPLLKNRIDLLVRNGYSGLIVVFILLWLLLDIRLSFWVSINVPMAFAGTFIVMLYYDITVNMITMFGMVMVLGIVVDNSIVIGEAIYTARKRGLPPVKAAVEGVAEVGLPIIASTTTNMVSFIPLFFIPGFVGRLAGTLPIVTIAAFIFSLIECLLLFPAHMNHLPDMNVTDKSKNIVSRIGLAFHRYTNHGLVVFIEKQYEPFVWWTMRWRYVTASIALAVLLISWGLFSGGFVKVDFFPKIDGNSMAASVEFPSGTTMAVTTATVIRIEEAARRLAELYPVSVEEPMLHNVFSLTGAHLDEKGQISLGTHYGTVRVELLDSVKRNIHITELMAAWEREIGEINGAISLTIRGDETTSPPGRPIDIWMKGRDLDQLGAAATELKEKLGTYEGLYQIKDDFRVGKKEINLKLKPEARALGLHVYDLAKQIFTGYFGEELMRVQRGDNNLRIRLRYPEQERTQVSDLEKMRVRVSMPHKGVMTTTAMNEAKMKLGTGLPDLPPKVQEVPLTSVADLEYKAGVTSIQRTNGQRRVAVSAEVDISRANANEIVAELKSGFLPQLVHKYPGISLSFEGDQQDFREALDYLAIAYPLALLGIFVLVAASFRSYIQTIVVMIAVPFGSAAALFGHLMFGYDISIMSILGFVALSGVVVNDGIVLVDCVNTYISEGESFYEAVRRAGARRFRAIFLTTATTVGGLAPLMLEKDTQAQMLIPMALAMSAGVAFSMLVSLLIVPCTLCIINDARRVAHWALHGVMPTPEEVEPARFRNLIE